MHTLQGYVEWHIANTIQAIMLANNVDKLDIILGGGAALSLIEGELVFVVFVCLVYLVQTGSDNWWSLFYDACLVILVCLVYLVQTGSDIWWSLFYDACLVYLVQTGSKTMY
jgi:hypothetical protein